jgi:membrane-associated phospholipid phosphatase
VTGFAEQASTWDASGTAWLRRRAHAPALDATLSGASVAVEHGRLWLACCAVGAIADADRRSSWLRAGVVVAAAEISSQSLKRAVRRPRRHLDGLPPLAETPSVFSFPSAHTAMSVAAARSFPRARRTIRAAAAAMALSRPYLGVHYPSDVIAGAVLGYLLGTAATASTRRAG